MHPSPALLLLLPPLYAAAAAANNTNAAAAAAPSSVPSLSTVRSTLANLEDSIIAALISRAKLPSSSAAVLKNWYGGNGDFIRYLQPFERDFAALGKYDAGTGEVPFTLAYPVTGSDFGGGVGGGAGGAGKGEGGEGESFSVNDEVYRQYIDLVIPGIASFTDNTNTNTNNSNSIPAPSTANTTTTPPSPATLLSADYALLSLLSRRVHYGKFVAEAKYASAPSLFTNLTDASRIRALLTDTAQEGVVRRRTAAKAAYAGARLDFDAGTGELVGVGTGVGQGVVDAGWVGGRLFGEVLIPVTTGVEVRWVEVRNRGG